MSTSIVPVALILLCGMAGASGCQTQESTAYTPPPASPDARPAAPLSGTSSGEMAAQTEFNGSTPAWSSAELAFAPSASAYEHVIASALPLEAPVGIADHHAPNAVQLTYTFDGSDFDPCISTEGSTLVYASTQHRPTADIYSKRVGSSVITQLTNDPASDAMPVLSPDGARVAFCSDRNGNWDIFIMPCSGGNAVQLTTDASPEVHPSWSPDGSRLVFGRLGQTTGRWELWVIDVTNPTVAEFIGYGMFPEWCPTAGTGIDAGDRILFQRSRERGDRAFGLWTLDYSEGQVGNLTQLIASPLSAFINASWSPDGTHIVFASVPTPSEWTATSGARPPKAELWMMPIEGGSRVALTAGDAIDLMPTWGPDNRIYFVSDRSGADNIWSLDLSPAILAATGSQPASRSVITGQGVRTVPLGEEHPVANVQESDHE